MRKDGRVIDIGYGLVGGGGGVGVIESRRD